MHMTNPAGRRDDATEDNFTEDYATEEREWQPPQLAPDPEKSERIAQQRQTQMKSV